MKHARVVFECDNPCPRKPIRKKAPSRKPTDIITIDILSVPCVSGITVEAVDKNQAVE